MNLKELLDKINKKKEEVRALATEGKVKEAKEAKKDLIKMQEQFDLLNDLDGTPNGQGNGEGIQNKATPVNKAKNVAGAFINAIKSAILGTRMSDEDATIVNQMKEGSGEDGGLTVPEDISTTIHELRRSEDALETLVNVENVSKVKGSRIYEVNADSVPFDNVDEEAEFPEADTPTLKKVNYTIKKKGGILSCTQELIKDSAENILAFLKKWIAKKSKATRNALILNKIKEITTEKEVSITGIDDFKDVFNVKLDPAIAVSSGIVTNQDGFNWLDKLKDSDGDYILQKDITDKTKRLLFGTYPVHVISNKVLKTTENKVPFICGDLKEAITIYDLEKMTVEMTNIAAGAFEKDLVKIKVRERLDCQAIDDEAIVMCQYTQA